MPEGSIPQPIATLLQTVSRPPVLPACGPRPAGNDALAHGAYPGGLVGREDAEALCLIEVVHEDVVLHATDAAR